MKKLFPILMAVSLVACATLYPPAPPDKGICDKTPQAVLCQAFDYIGKMTGQPVTPETANDMLLDASLVSIWQKWMDHDKLLSAVERVEKFFNDNPVLSLNTLIKYTVKEANLDPALALLLSRRLKNFEGIPNISDMILDPDSRSIIAKHFANQKEQLSWF